jgi:hypothetical protein
VGPTGTRQSHRAEEQSAVPPGEPQRFPFYRGCLCHCDVAAGLTTKPGPATVISFDCLLRKQGERVERKGLLI